MLWPEKKENKQVEKKTKQSTANYINILVDRYMDRGQYTNLSSVNFFVSPDLSSRNQFKKIITRDTFNIILFRIFFIS